MPQAPEQPAERHGAKAVESPAAMNEQTLLAGDGLSGAQIGRHVDVLSPRLAACLLTDVDCLTSRAPSA
jgi:hypothetical protein